MELYLLIFLCVVAMALVVLLLGQRRALAEAAAQAVDARMAELRRELAEGQSQLRRELSESNQSAMRALGDSITSGQNTKFTDIQNIIAQQLKQQEQRFATFAVENRQELELMRGTVDKRLTYLQEDNSQKLNEMRKIVDEKLQQTLEDKMNKSFALVSERLEQVYKGLGEMQALATGVGDLKKVLSNVKARGILGEIQLGAILEEILAPEQYETNVAVRPGSKQVVEYAIKLPTEDGAPVYLPIDSKFPADAYGDLRDAYEEGSPEAVTQAWAVLATRLRTFAKDIRDKYIDPPNTTEFAIMFLPFEGLYAEVVNRGMLEVLQRDYKVNIAGPSTMAALLNSLQMGFKTFAIQKRSGEVWKVLGAVKTEFERFGKVLADTQNRIEQANRELDKLVGVRTRRIIRSLKDVATLPEIESRELLGAVDYEEYDEPVLVGSVGDDE